MKDALLLPAPFNPDLTLCGGQAFRWTKAPDHPIYQGVIADMVVQVAPAASGQWSIHLLNHPLTPTRQQQLQVYFDLDRDYATAHQAVVERLAALHRADAHQTDQPHAFTGPPTADFPPGPELHRDYLDHLHLSGLRLLRQPWFEVMVSFVISSNNHLPRIRQIINIISRTFGKPLTPTHYTFPTPADLAAASTTTLRQTCRVGYRDQALHQLALHIATHLSFWETAANTPTTELRRHLLTLPGVGPKVAECILLFGFHRWEAFPIDTWVRRALLAGLAPPSPRPPTNRQLASFATTAFGPWAGLAQQYLFERARRQYRTRSPECAAGPPLPQPAFDNLSVGSSQPGE